MIIGVGANLDRRALRFLAASRILSLLLVSMTRSSVFRSEPVGYLDQAPFWNAAVAGYSELPPPELLARLKQIEQALGRRPRFRNGPREIDLDLLAVEGVEMRGGELELPHPRLLERPFALVPAAELAPTLVVAADAEPLARLAARCDRTGLTPLVPPESWHRLGEIERGQVL